MRQFWNIWHTITARQHAFTRWSQPLLRLALLLALVVPAAASKAAVQAMPCSSSGTWTPGEVSVYWFDVEQGDSQLIVGPTGKTLLIDLGETASDTSGTNTKAAQIATKLRAICGTGSNPVALDYVMASHHHLDHIGYAANPNDTSTYGNGLYQLLTPNGLGFTVGTLIDRDAGTWVDANGNGRCEANATDSSPDEIVWHNAGTTSQAARRFICWLYGPDTQADRATIAGHVLTLKNNVPWPALDLGPGVTAAIINANGKDTVQADGVTPVSGNHTNQGGNGPPSENAYSIALHVAYGTWNYATAGDSDGDYNTNILQGYTYNNIENKLAPLYGNVDTMRANHHGSGYSSSQYYLSMLRPETAIFSCGSNIFGHPSNRVLDALRGLANERGTGADIYLTNNPCATYQADQSTRTNYSGTLNSNGDIVLRTTGSGSGYTIAYDTGSRSYTAYTGTTPPPGDPSKVVINEYLMTPSSLFESEWIELYNPTTSIIDLSWLYLDDLAGAGSAPKQIPAGTTIPAKGFYVMSLGCCYLNNTGTESVRFLKIANGIETVYNQTSYTLSSTQEERVFHRIGNAGQWCNIVSANITKGTNNPTTCP
jgi:beta-lactamase superfamily II metal-dependent hydrolase